MRFFIIIAIILLEFLKLSSFKRQFSNLFKKDNYGIENAQNFSRIVGNFKKSLTIIRNYIVKAQKRVEGLLKSQIYKRVFLGRGKGNHRPVSAVNRYVP